MFIRRYAVSTGPLARGHLISWFTSFYDFFLSGLPKVVYHWPGWATNFQNLTICLHTSEIKEGRKIIDFQIVIKGGLGFYRPQGGGFCLSACWDATPPRKQTPEYGLRAAGAHPTGMHSCSIYLLKGYIVFCITKGQLSSLFLSRCKRKTVRLELILNYFIIYVI